MAGISTHVLDIARGNPAQGVSVRLERDDSSGTTILANHVTDADGRVKTLLEEVSLQVGTHRLVFDVGSYHAAQGVAGFYPEVSIAFTVRNAQEHHHVPLLLSPFGYSTYRGS